MNSKRVFLVTTGHKDGAEAIANRLNELHNQGVITIESIATIVKDADGSVYVNDRDDVETGSGALAGAIAGGIVGALMGGIPGAIVGTGAGAVTGGTSASMIDLGMDREVLENISMRLKPDTSAVVAVLDKEFAGWFEETIIDEFGLTVKYSYYDMQDEAVEQWRWGSTVNDGLD